MLRTISLWPGLLCLVLHQPAHAIGKERGVGTHPDRPIRPRP